MNSRERMIAAMECRAVDRVPVLPCLWYDHIARVTGISYGELLAWPERTYDAADRARQFYGADGLRLHLGPPEGWREGTIVGEVDGETMLLSQKTRRPVAKFDLAGGGKIHLLDQSARIVDWMGWPVNLAVQSPTDVNNIPVTPAAQVVGRGQTDGIRRLVKQAAGRYFVVGFNGGFTINAIIRLRGPTQGLTDLVDEPRLVHAIIDRCLEGAIENAKAAVDAGVDAIYFGDSSASNSLISADHYREYCLPAYKTFVAALRAHNRSTKLYQHCCGDYTRLLEMAAEEGVDALHGLDPSKGMNLRDIRRRLGEKVCLWGGVATGTLLSGTADDVTKESLQCIGDGGPQGYILDAACAVPLASPLENVRAMCLVPLAARAP